MHTMFVITLRTYTHIFGHNHKISKKFVSTKHEYIKNLSQRSIVIYHFALQLICSSTQKSINDVNSFKIQTEPM